MNMPMREIDPCTREYATQDAGDAATLSAICNRTSRLVGPLNRRMLKDDIKLIQSRMPTDLEALAGAREEDFVSGLLKIVDAANDAHPIRDALESKLLPFPVSASLRS